MKKLIFIIILLIFKVSFGQDETEQNTENLVLKSTHWITDKCMDLNNHYENDLCVRQEINDFVNKKLDWSLTENMPKGNYEIRLNLMVEKDGGISKVIAKSEYKELNKELESVLILFQNRIKLIDQDGKTYKNNLIFPLNFKIE